MPNKNTFDIKPIKELIERYNYKNVVSIDPFANKNKIASITNDLDPQFDTEGSNLTNASEMRPFSPLPPASMSL